jgi:hypothetical protein
MTLKGRIAARGGRVYDDVAMTAKLSDVDPLASRTDVLAMPQNRLHELLPWEWKHLNLNAAA